MTVGADTEAVTTTLATISLIRDELGVNMCLGASNVSFGLPQRHVLNAALPADGDGRRADQRDHVDRARCACESVRAADLLLGHDAWGSSWIAAHRARKAAAAGGRDRAHERRVPQATRARARRAGGAGGRRPARPPALPARRRRGPRPQRDADVRRRELERDRHRLDLRRPRDVQEVQGPRRLRRGPGLQRRPARVHHRRAARRLAAGLPRRRAPDLVIEVPPLQTRPKAALVGVGRHVILRPAVQKRHLVLEEPTLEDQRSDLQRVLDALEDLEPHASIELLRDARRRRCARAHFDVTAVVCDEELIEVEPGRHDARGALPSPSTSAPRPWWPRCSTSRAASRRRCARCSTASSPSAPT